MTAKAIQPVRRSSPLLVRLAAGIGLLAACVAPVSAADFAEVRSAYNSGDYEACIELTTAEVEKGIWNDFWSRQLIRTLLTTGRFEDAREVYELVETKFSNSIPLRVLAAETYRFCGESDKGDRLLEEIPGLVQAAPWRYSDRDNILAIGRYLVSQGHDAREVLEKFYDRALRTDPQYVDAHVAIAELALQKADYQEAVKSLDKARELRSTDPYIRYLLAKAWAPSDSEVAAEHLMAALELNPYHPESLLLHARQLIDSERYQEAEQVLQEAFEVNPAHPLAWALKAAIAHLRGEYRQEGEYRSQGLSTWNLNPEVDYLIGLTLSKHYRFAEGVQYQRRALRMDPNYMPARFQLAQDLLRVGEDEEGWSIVDRVSLDDKYNVVAYNLKTLHDRLEQFTTLEVPGFLIRMDSREAKIYGPRVVELLREAQEVLSREYEFELTQPVTVEIFPQQSDFAIRTFGLPGGAGFLGVCFGSLITANSPASQGDTPSNWESVLWHEFCHVITLQKTQNRMPRWLSEGISVYEEVERNSTWGQRMTPTYKAMILGEDFVPLSELSGAFLNPKSPQHLQFAYYESSLAVRYLIETHGKPLLRKSLVDLGMGVPLDETFARRFGDAKALDEDFARYAKGQAEAFLADTDFGSHGLSPRASVVDLERWQQERPNSYLVQRQIVERLVASKQWEAALPEAHKLAALYPSDSDPGGALELLVTIAQGLQDTALERQSLAQLLKYSSDNVPALRRISTLCREAEDWTNLATYSRTLLAVQPLVSAGHRNLVEATRQLGPPSQALGSLRALKEMDPLDPAGLHFELAQTLASSNNIEEARLEVLQALEYSPRYRDAQKLLVEIHRKRHSSQETLDVIPPEEGQPPSPSRGSIGTLR